MQHLPKISLIATTYNRPDALRLCLESIGRQTLVPFEVIIADDGSTDDTRALIEKMRTGFPYPIVHAWQDDLGFRAAEVRNNALRLCKGEYVIFIDGDIILHPHFVEDHAKMAQPGYYVIGSRAKFSAKATARMLAGGAVHAHWYSKGVSRRMNALYLPRLGPLTVGYRKSKPLYGRSCNMAAWLTDLYAVNGFDAEKIRQIPRRGIPPIPPPERICRGQRASVPQQPHRYSLSPRHPQPRPSQIRLISIRLL